MKTRFKTISLLAIFALVMLTGCVSKNSEYHEEKEYSDMPWNTPQQWENSRQLPGMTPR